MQELSDKPEFINGTVNVKPQVLNLMQGEGPDEFDLKCQLLMKTSNYCAYPACSSAHHGKKQESFPVLKVIVWK